MITLAPELEWATSVVKGLAARGIVVSVGHSCGDICHGVDAFRAGARCITHLFNAMASFHHRDPGLIGMLMHGARGDYPVYYGLVCDGYHTHEASQYLAHSMHPNGELVSCLFCGGGGVSPSCALLPPPLPPPVPPRASCPGFVPASVPLLC